MEAKKIVCTCLITIPCAIIGHETYAANEGAFIGLGAGYDVIHTPNHSVFDTASPLAGLGNSVVVNKNKHDIGGFGALFYAGYNFSHNFGLEASYNHYANSNYSTTQSNLNSGVATAIVHAKLEFKTHTYDIVAKGYLPFDNGFELFARAGASYVIQKVNYSNNSGTFVVPVGNNDLATPSIGDTTTKRIRPTVGLGAGFNFTKNWEMSFAWNHVFGSGNLKSSTSAIADLDMITLDITYSFV